MDLVLFGYQNLINAKCNLSSAPSFRGNSTSIQRIANARASGSTVVDRRIPEKAIQFTGSLKASTGVSFQDVLKEYSLAFSQEDRYLRVSPNYFKFTLLDNELSYQLAGDATSLSFDNAIFQSGSGSIQFNADVSIASGYAGVYSESGESHDISSYGNDGALEAWVYLPRTSNITGVTIRAGSDSSNYYQKTITSQYDDMPLSAGWNYISTTLDSCEITGVVDPYSFGSYVYLVVDYNASMTDTSGFRFGGLLFQQESLTRNYKGYFDNFNVDKNHYDIDRANMSLSFLAYEGVSESTSQYNVLGLADQTNAITTGVVNFDGSYTPLPIITMNFSSATNVSSVSLSNTTTGDSVAITKTYSAGDKIIVDTKKKNVTSNGTVVDYDDVLPRFVLGENTLQISISTTSLETIDELTQNSNLTGEV